ncbi:MAG: hypothetical protein FWG63_04665 [Defluviitaleaceae bacterium]|nr:hypothetical protein [Defluviitaleaceae bacterium]
MDTSSFRKLLFFVIVIGIVAGVTLIGSVVLIISESGWIGPVEYPVFMRLLRIVLGLATSTTALSLLTAIIVSTTSKKLQEEVGDLRNRIIELERKAGNK